MSRAIWLLSLAAFISAATTRACDALLPEIAASFSVSVGAAAVAITAFTFAYGAFQLVYGPIGVRIGPYRLVMIATLLAASGAFVCAVADSLGWLTVGRFWSGMTAAAIIPMSMAYIGNTVAYDQRQTALARFSVGQVSGVIMGQAFAGLFAELFSWRQLFVVLGVGFLAVCAALWLELKRGAVPAGEPQPAPLSPLAQYLRVLTLPWARVVLITVALEGFLCFGAFPFIAVLLKQDFGLNYLTIGLLMAMMGVGGLGYVVLVRWLLARLGESGLALAGGGLLLAGFVLTAAGPLWPLIGLATGLIGLGFYMLHNTLQTNATQMAPFDRSSAISLFAFALFVGQALGAALIGIAGERFGYRGLFIAAGVGLALLALWFAALKRRQLAATV